MGGSGGVWRSAPTRTADAIGTATFATIPHHPKTDSDNQPTDASVATEKRVDGWTPGLHCATLWQAALQVESCNSSGLELAIWMGVSRTLIDAEASAPTQATCACGITDRTHVDSRAIGSRTMFFTARRLALPAHPQMAGPLLGWLTCRGARVHERGPKRPRTV